MDDGSTPPMILGPSANSPESQTSLAIFFSVLLFLFALYIVYEAVVSRWLHGPEEWQKTQLEGQEHVRDISKNVHLILEQLVAFPTRREMYTSMGMRLLPYLFLLLLLVSIILIQDGIGHKGSPAWWGEPARYEIKPGQTQAGLILFFLSANGFMTCKAFEYYKTKTELRKKAAAHHAALHARHHSGGSSGAVGSSLSRGVAEPVDSAAMGSAPWRVQWGPKNFPGSLSRAHLLPESAPQVGGTDTLSLSRSIGSDGRSSRDSDWSNPSATEPAAAVIVAVEGQSNGDSSRAAAAVAVGEARGDATENFDNDFEYIRRLKHILPQYNTVYLNSRNLLQILILFVEFLQWASFPLRDLMANEGFQVSLQSDQSGSAFVASVHSFLNTISAGLPNVDTRLLSNLQFAVSWWCCLLALVAAVGGIVMTKLLRSDYFGARPTLRKTVKKVLFGNWILLFLPLVNMFYLIIFTAFINLIGCISNSTSPIQSTGRTIDEAKKIRIEQCSPVVGNPPMQVWFALVGYLMGYYVFTIFKIADDQKPQEGMISFTTRSEVINKNAGLLLLLLYTLIPTPGSATARGVLACFVLSGLIFYQVVIGSSFVRWVNLFRTASFLLVLWMSICVVYFTHPQQSGFYTSSGSRPWVVVALAITMGWIIVLSAYAVVYFMYLRQLEQRSTAPRDGIHYTHRANEESRFIRAIDDGLETVAHSLRALRARLEGRELGEGERVAPEAGTGSPFIEGSKKNADPSETLETEPGEDKLQQELLSIARRPYCGAFLPEDVAVDPSRHDLKETEVATSSRPIQSPRMSLSPLPPATLTPTLTLPLGSAASFNDAVSISTFDESSVVESLSSLTVPPNSLEATFLEDDQNGNRTNDEQNLKKVGNSTVPPLDQPEDSKHAHRVEEAQDPDHRDNRPIGGDHRAQQRSDGGGSSNKVVVGGVAGMGGVKRVLGPRAMVGPLVPKQTGQ
ncbi:hypothetical protein DFJ73DRAFT_832952 [Zopfochytrium polystomum]|nr:hypothetical protein DFJ73DRAFT_832952 [Zopfochytrium polystomum]